MSKYSGNDTVQLTSPPRSEFDMSHTKRMSVRAGKLVPCMVAECVPGDTWRGSSENLVRMAPMLAPIYEDLTVYVHFFFVPHRLLWGDEWEDFITGGRLGTGVEPVDAPIPPRFDIGTCLSFHDEEMEDGGLPDYLGVPNFTQLIGGGSYTGLYMDAMPFGAYQKIYMDWYRDRNYVPDDRYEFPMASGTISPTSTGAFSWLDLQTRNYRPDYFRSALPFTQRGSEVLMPLAGTGSVTYMDQSLATWSTGASPNAPGPLTVSGLDQKIRDDDDHQMRIENIDSVEFDASSVSINDFRSAYALQVWLERNAVAGSRYVESNRAHFNVRTQDYRLQRSEFLGGGRIRIKVSEIVSTAYSDDGAETVPLANLAGHGVTYGNTNQFRYFCPEHGFIMGIMSIMNEASYFQGLPRMFRRRTFLDYPWPTFAKLGEQQVDKAELYATPDNLTENGDGVLPNFGYQSRYSDWKQIMSTNHGEFRSSLLFWTMTRNFSGSPTLGEAFVKFDESTQDRIFAVPSEQRNFWCYVNNQLTVTRALPYFGTPNTLGFS